MLSVQNLPKRLCGQCGLVLCSDSPESGDSDTQETQSTEAGTCGLAPAETTT